MPSQDNFDELLKNVQKNPDDGSIKQHLLASLSANDRKKLQQMLSDRQAVEELLKTPKAQELLKKINDQRQNG